MVMLRHILLLIIVSTSLNAYSNTLKSLNINSTDLVINRQKMSATFSGNVVLCFQDVKLLGSKAVFYFENDKLKKIQSIKVQNNVKAQQQDGAIVLADEATFVIDSSELRLSGHVVIEKGENIMYSKEMVYYGKVSQIILGK